MFLLTHTMFLYAFAAIPLAMLIYFFAMRRRKKKMQEFAELPLFRRLVSDRSVSKKNLRFILALTALFFIVCAIVDPETGSHLQDVENKGSDIVIAMDVSNSMNAQDIIPSR